MRIREDIEQQLDDMDLESLAVKSDMKKDIMIELLLDIRDEVYVYGEDEEE